MKQLNDERRLIISALNILRSKPRQYIDEYSQEVVAATFSQLRMKQLEIDVKIQALTEHLFG